MISLSHFILIVTLLYYIKLIMCVSAVNVQISSILSDEERFSFLNKCMKHKTVIVTTEFRIQIQGFIKSLLLSSFSS